MYDQQHGVLPMSLHVPEPTFESHQNEQFHPGRRHHRPDDNLVLVELNPSSVIDHLDDEGAPLNLLSFGNVREICPKCGHPHLKLVLRQTAVRVAHLFCADCESCFDARYTNGAPALTI
jgi:hypothetical protein